MTVIYSADSDTERNTKRPVAVLPLLVILFIVSYGILTMLVFEQGQTIESQRGLIREMLKDSTQLASMKGKLTREEAARQQDEASAPGDGVKAGASSSQRKDPDAKGTTLKESDKEGRKSGKATRSTHQLPTKPQADLEDVRRATQVI